MTNTEGEIFLGHTADLVNPCGDYWDADANDYVLYEVEYPESGSIDPERAMRNMHSLFRLATDSEERNKSLKKVLRLHQISEIRSWLLINNKCKGPVYIDADLCVTCNGERIEIDPTML